MRTVVWNLTILPNDFEVDKDKTNKNVVLAYNNGNELNRLFVPVQINRSKNFNKLREEIINTVNNVFDKAESL